MNLNDLLGSFGGNFGNLEEMAGKLGLPAESIAPLMQQIGADIASGKTSVAALAETAAAHGVSADALQEMMSSFGGPEAIMGKLGGLFDKDGDGNPLNELGGLAKGLFG